MRRRRHSSGVRRFRGLGRACCTTSERRSTRHDAQQPTADQVDQGGRRLTRQGLLLGASHVVRANRELSVVRARALVGRQIRSLARAHRATAASSCPRRSKFGRRAANFEKISPRSSPSESASASSCSKNFWRLPAVRCMRSAHKCGTGRRRPAPARRSHPALALAHAGPP